MGAGSIGNSVDHDRCRYDGVHDSGAGALLHAFFGRVSVYFEAAIKSLLGLAPKTARRIKAVGSGLLGCGA